MKQSIEIPPLVSMDCFVACAPRNDGADTGYVFHDS